MIWQPHITTSGEWYAAKVLQGIFGAPMESIAEITVSDVVKLHLTSGPHSFYPHNNSLTL